MFIMPGISMADLNDKALKSAKTRVTKRGKRQNRAIVVANTSAYIDGTHACIYVSWSYFIQNHSEKCTFTGIIMNNIYTRLSTHYSYKRATTSYDKTVVTGECMHQSVHTVTSHMTSRQSHHRRRCARSCRLHMHA